MEEKAAIYQALEQRNTKGAHATDVQADVLAVFFAVLAYGSQSNVELPPNHPSGQMYIGLAQRALTTSRFLTRNTIRAVQCLVSNKDLCYTSQCQLIWL